MLTPVPRKKAKTASAVIFLRARLALEFNIEIETTQFDYKPSFQNSSGETSAFLADARL